MKKNTLEEIENIYKEAIRNKFRIERVEGKHSHYLNNPSQALLRDLCWDIFSSNPKTDDLSVYRNFFRTEFKSEEDTSTTYTNKFKKVGGFYKGDKEPANISTVDLAAILVDFHPRPFNKFKKEIDEEEMKLINELRDTNFTSKEASSNELIEETQIKGFADVQPDLNKHEVDKDLKQVEDMTIVSKPVSINSIERIKKTILVFLYKIKNTAIATLLIFSLIITVIYFAFFKNDCMQWSEDHYEIVDCSSKNDENLNEIIPLDKDLLDFRKLKACDTTNCFKKNGDAFIWYTKTPGGGIDFFNDHGRHPENKRPLRPVSHYIYNRYLKGKPCK